MRTTNDILAAASIAGILLVASVPTAFGATAKPITKLTKTAAAAAAKKDAQAAAMISGGDKVVVSNCRTYGKTAFKCAIELIPETSTSICRWTDTIRPVQGKLVIKYSSAVCS
jgi:type II secretory pathway pseudopilin PulG